jgi:hypothetical protein
LKLYVTNKSNEKVFLNLTANTRRELVHLVGGQIFRLGDDIYNINQVTAESDINNTATGTIVGGVLGALGGPFGILIGGLLGGMLGNSSDDSEKVKVDQFNNS